MDVQNLMYPDGNVFPIPQSKHPCFLKLIQMNIKYMKFKWHFAPHFALGLH